MSRPEPLHPAPIADTPEQPPAASGPASVQPVPPPSASSSALDVERDSDVPISTQIYWQLAYQSDSGRLLPGARLAPVRDLGAALRVNPNTIRAPGNSRDRK